MLKQFRWLWYKEWLAVSKKLGGLSALAGVLAVFGALLVGLAAPVETFVLLGGDVFRKLVELPGINTLVSGLWLFTVLLWSGTLLFALYHLSLALNAERSALTLPFYKSLPISDWRYSAAKFVFHGGLYPACALGLALALWSMLVGSLAVAQILKPNDAITVIATIARVITGVSIGFGSPEQPIRLDGMQIYVLMSGLCFLLGSIVRHWAFLYALLCYVGATIAANMLPDASPAARQFVVGIAGLSYGGRWLFILSWTMLCFVSATLIYRAKEV